MDDKKLNLCNRLAKQVAEYGKMLKGHDKGASRLEYRVKGLTITSSWSNESIVIPEEESQIISDIIESAINRELKRVEEKYSKL